MELLGEILIRLGWGAPPIGDGALGTPFQGGVSATTDRQLNAAMPSDGMRKNYALRAKTKQCPNTVSSLLTILILRRQIYPSFS